MYVRKLFTVAGWVLSLLLAALFTGAQTPVSSDVTVESQVRRTLQELYEASDNRDEATVMKIYAEDCVLYDPDSGQMTLSTYKYILHPYFSQTGPDRIRYSTKLDDIKVLIVNAGSAVASYKMVSTSIEGGKTKSYPSHATDVFVQRNGRWQILAEHLSDLPNPVEPVIAGMPVGWDRSLERNGNNYAITVDNKVRHSGKASASIRFSCGVSEDSWVSIGQAIAADNYLGKRVRLTGWLKTDDADWAGLWLRIDGETRMLGFDNMGDRPVRGTTGWTQYSVVLDVPADAVNIRFGALLNEKGELWADDLALEIVDKNVRSTDLNQGKPGEVDPTLAEKKKSEHKDPVNTGFENGTVK